MHMKFLVFIILFLSIFVSCKKGKADFILKGTVSDNTFSTYHSGATIKLYQVPVASTQEILIATSVIGEDGTYSFTFPREKMEKYIVKIIKTNYFDIEKTVYFSELVVGEDNIRNYATTSKSWVGLRFINQNPIPNDQLKYIKQEGKENCSECCSDTEQNYYGAIDTTIYCVNDGNTNYSYYYWIIGSTNQGLKVAYTIPFDTVEIVLVY